MTLSSVVSASCLSGAGAARPSARVNPSTHTPQAADAHKHFSRKEGPLEWKAHFWDEDPARSSLIHTNTGENQVCWT